MEMDYKIQFKVLIEESNVIPLKLERFSLSREVWTYLTVQDIINLLITSKEMRKMCRRINIDLPQVIKFRLFDKRKRFKKKIILRNLLNSFPNVSKLIFLTKDMFSSGDRILRLGMIGFSLQPLYKNIFIQKNLKELKMNVQCDQYLNGISNLTNITSLDLSFTSSTDAIYLEDSEHLMFSLNNLTNDGLLYISSLTNITLLNLHGCCNLSNEGLCHLSKLINLNHLDLSHCEGISDEGLSHLSLLRHISYLDLARCNITDVGLLHLSLMTSIFHLNVSMNRKITNEGLRNPLSSFKKISYLNLHCCNRITNEGFRQFSSNLTTIKHLSLSNTLLSFVGLSFLTTNIGLTYLNLNTCEITDNFIFQISKSLINMKTLKLNYCRNITDIGLSYITSLVHLEHLGIMQCNITDNGLLHLSSLLKLSYLQIEPLDDDGINIITNTGLLYLSLINSLTFLEIMDCKDITYEGFSNLISLTNLKQLHVYNCRNITNENLIQIFPSSVNIGY